MFLKMVEIKQEIFANIDCSHNRTENVIDPKLFVYLFIYVGKFRKMFDIKQKSFKVAYCCFFKLAISLVLSDLK